MEKRREEELDEGSIANFQEEEEVERLLDSANSVLVGPIESQQDAKVMNEVVNLDVLHYTSSSSSTGVVQPSTATPRLG